MHPLLRRQLAKAYAEPALVPAELESLLSLVDEAYRQADVDRSLVERSLDISSEELSEANRDLGGALAQAARSEERYRSLVEASQNGIAIVDHSFIVSYANKSLAQLLGLDVPALVGTNALDLIHEEDRARVGARVPGLTDRSYAATRRELRLRAPRGNELVALVSTTALPADELGQKQTLVEVRDVTEEARLRMAEAQHQEREHRQELVASIANSVATGLIVVDADGSIMFSNRLFGQFMGLDESEIAGRSLREILRGVSGRTNRPDLEFEIPRLAHDEDAGRSAEFVVAAPARRHLRVTAFDVVSVSGSGRRVGFMVADVSREREVDAMKSEFVALASHELRTPLTGVLGFAALLAESVAIPPEELEWATHIRTEATRLVGVVSALLDVSRLEANELDLDLDRVDVERVAQEVASLFAHASDRHRVFLSPPAGKTPAGKKAVVAADPDALRQIVTNLVDNAIKYSPAGGYVEVSWEVVGSAVRIDVSDEGLGIDEADQARVFDRFERVAHPETRNVRSTGLGLYLVKRMVTHMGGDVSVRSAVGRGSTFSLALPLAEGPETQEAAA